jgi:hypothetical protein
MSLPTAMVPAILDAVLDHLTPHFLLGTRNDPSTARQAAAGMLAAYNASTDEELRLAAEITSFSFHALEALSEAAAADLSLNRKLRLRGSAVSLSREAHKSQRKLDQLQRARLAATSQPQPESQASSPGQPADTQALALIDFARQAIDASAKKANANKPGGQVWTISRQQRRAAQRIVEKAQRHATEHARREAQRAKRAPAQTTPTESVEAA